LEVLAFENIGLNVVQRGYKVSGEHRLRLATLRIDFRGELSATVKCIPRRKSPTCLKPTSGTHSLPGPPLGPISSGPTSIIGESSGRPFSDIFADTSSFTTDNSYTLGKVAKNNMALFKILILVCRASP